MCDFKKIFTKQEVIKNINSNFNSAEYLRDVWFSIKYLYWEKELYNFFSGIHESLYHDLILKKTYISLDTKKTLEKLASPIYKKPDLEKEKEYKKLFPE